MQRASRKSTAAKLQTPAGPMSRAEMADHYRIPFGTICRLLWKGWTVEQIINKPPRPHAKPYAPKPKPSKFHYGRFYTPWGRTSLERVAGHLNVSARTLQNRVYVYGWSEEDAFNTPVRGKRGRDRIISSQEWRERTAQANGRFEAKFEIAA